MRWAILWMAVILFTVHFSLQNSEVLALKLSFRYSVLNYQLFEVSEVPLLFVIVCSISLGVLVGGVWDFYRRIQFKKALRQKEKTIEELGKEIQSVCGPGADQAGRSG